VELNRESEYGETRGNTSWRVQKGGKESDGNHRSEEANVTSRGKGGSREPKDFTRKRELTKMEVASKEGSVARIQSSSSERAERRTRKRAAENGRKRTSTLRLCG